MARVLIITVLGIQMIAGVAYCFAGDWKRGIYWLLASALGINVTIS